MTIIQKIFLYSALALLVTAPMVARDLVGDCVPVSGDPIRLGVILPREAFFTAENSDTFNGIEAMRQAVNACGGVNGRPVEWVYEPAADQEAAQAAATKLITDEGVPLIIGSGLVAVNEGGRLAAEALGAVYWEVTEAVDPGGEWYYSIRPDNLQLGEASGQFVSNVLTSTLSKNDLNVALIYENRPRGQTIAEGVLASLPKDPVMLYNYTDHLSNTRQLGVQLREEQIDAVILAAFEDDGDNLWYAARQADANVGAWLHIGGDGYRREMCERLGNSDGFISVDASGAVNTTFREEIGGEIYQQYRKFYLSDHSKEPREMADLAASGVYVLLRYVLSETTGNYTAQDIREAILRLDERQPAGLMGEGISFADSNGRNAAASVVIQQAQSGMFCSVWPSDLATCLGGIQPFPTWRERALAEEKQSCGPQV